MVIANRRDPATLGGWPPTGGAHVPRRGAVTRVANTERMASPAPIPAPPLEVRPAGPHDAAAIGAIYDEAVTTGVATFAAGPHTAGERRAWLAARPARAPVFVGVHDGEVRAWSALAPLTHRSWYGGVAEYTVHVARRARGQGLGARMLAHLIGVAGGYGYWKLVGMIISDNAPGLGLARDAGFRVVGTHRGHAPMGGRWRDVTVVELHLGGDPPA